MTLPRLYSSRLSFVSQWSTEKIFFNIVHKLPQSLYDLKQEPQKWYSKLSSTLLTLGFTQSKADYSLVLKDTSTFITVILVYVDDFLIINNSIAPIPEIKNYVAHILKYERLRGDIIFSWIRSWYKLISFLCSWTQVYSWPLGRTQSFAPQTFSTTLKHQSNSLTWTRWCSSWSLILSGAYRNLIYVTITRHDVYFCTIVQESLALTNNNSLSRW